jgi:hypothetical protein
MRDMGRGDIRDLACSSDWIEKKEKTDRILINSLEKNSSKTEAIGKQH